MQFRRESMALRYNKYSKAFNSRFLRDRYHYQMSEILPSITEDEIELEPDTKRDQEIADDKPPHH
jgi:hypothetical protein